MSTSSSPGSEGAYREQQSESRHDGWLIFGVVFAGMCLIASMIAWGFAARSVSDAKNIRASTGSQSAAATASSGAPTIHLSEYKIDPATFTAHVGDTLTVQNDGSMQHNLSIQGQSLATPLINAGDSSQLVLSGLSPGTYTVYCSVPGHQQLGMQASMTLVAAASAASTTAGTSMPGMNMATPSAAMTPAQAAAMQTAMETSTKAFPAKTQGGPGAQPLNPTVLPDGTKQFDLTAEIVKWEVSPGKFVEAWTYNGTVPGPTIQVNIGDKVSVVLHNKLPEATTIHFHGIEAPFADDGTPYIAQDPVEPGATYTYSFVAKGPAVGMYHSHFDAVDQVADGMAGALLIGNEPLPATVDFPVTNERAVPVPPQSQIQQQILFLDDSGTLGLTVNGKSFPATAPIVANQGQWIEVQYYNEGNMIHPFHLHEIPQLVIAKDGYPTPPQLMDTVPVAPGERYTVLVRASDVGIWAWHCHILARAEDSTGMFGMVTALIVNGPNGKPTP